MNKPENHFILYFEIQAPDYNGKLSKVLHCDSLTDLVYNIRESIRLNHENVIINTLQNAKPKSNED